MNAVTKEKITSSQVTIAVASFIISDGFIVTAKSAAETVGTPDVWLSLLAGGILCLLLAYLQAKLSQAYPEKTYFEYSQHIAGKAIGYVCSFLFIIYLIMITGHELRSQAEFIRHNLLDETPIEVTMAAFLLIGVYLILGGINPLVRMQELLFPFTIIVILLVFVFGMKDFHLYYLRPVLSEGIGPVLRGIKTTPFAYLGFETILILTAFMAEPQKAVRTVVSGLTISIVLYVLNGAILVGVLTEREVMTLTWPLMEFTRSIEFPGGFFENFEILFFIIWLIRFFSTFALAYYFGCLGISQLFNLRIEYIVLAMIPLIFWIGISGKDIDAVFAFAENLGYYGIIVSGIVPVLLYVIHLLKDRVADET
ncbi:hypothetical protein EDM56_07875 [Brevibacillus fluminis]|uniref:Uncharacterized protein n=1 Tax=Brevibacillus fluminis TaxID=511487 RepID=A0A3M8DQM4_9BACL|nr:GerAB/ArcD/ProY family transporter [Brevibacillus fluminis]RNB90420.1 hypothetical protein EDM56_07875 [Brevibacillus fluminis]